MNCYLCNEILNSKNDHKEHIFQQALGGRLSESGILCRRCGNKLGKEIDSKFIDIFKNYTSRIPIYLDRSTGKKFSEIGKIFIPELNEEFDFRMNEKNLLPARIEAFNFDGRLIVLYPEGAPSKNLEGFKKSKMKEFGMFDESKVVVIRNFNDFSENLYVLPFNMDNLIYKQGMAKIAIGFSIFSGIKREWLECVLDVDYNKIREDIQLLPYMPWGFVDSAIEEVRFISNDFRYFSHQIKVFNLENKLFCYIELFGTFQCYILLSERYEGEGVNESYMQPIFNIKRKKLDCLPYGKDFLFYKHLLKDGESFDYTEDTLKKINDGIGMQENVLCLNEYYSDLLGSVSHNIFLFKSPCGKNYVEKGLKDFFEENSDILNSDSLFYIYEEMKILTSEPSKVKACFDWNVLCDFQFKYRDKVYGYNCRKMRRLEDMIKVIQNDDGNSHIWDVSYSKENGCEK